MEPTFIPSLTAVNDITFTSGLPVMTGTVNLYNIYYGNFSSESSQQMKPLVDYFSDNIGSSDYYNIMTKYYQIIQGVKTFVSNSVKWIKSISISSNIQIPLDNSKATAIITNLISTGQLPLDPNGVYAFIFKGNIPFSTLYTGSWLTTWCGYHSAFYYTDGKTLIKYFITGDPSTSTASNAAGCKPAARIGATTTPNNNVGADSIASIYAHELVEVVSNYAGAWYWRTGGPNLGKENADLCTGSFGPLLPGSTDANVIVGAKKWLIQQNWIPQFGCGTSLPQSKTLFNDVFINIL